MTTPRSRGVMPLSMSSLSSSGVATTRAESMTTRTRKNADLAPERPRVGPRPAWPCPGASLRSLTGVVAGQRTHGHPARVAHARRPPLVMAVERRRATAHSHHGAGHRHCAERGTWRRHRRARRRPVSATAGPPGRAAAALGLALEAQLGRHGRPTRRCAATASARAARPPARPAGPPRGRPSSRPRASTGHGDVGQPDGDRLGRPHETAGRADLQRPRHPDERHQRASCRPGPGTSPSEVSRMANCTSSATTPQVSGQRQLEPGADRVALDRRHDHRRHRAPTRRSRAGSPRSTSAAASALSAAIAIMSTSPGIPPGASMPRSSPAEKDGPSPRSTTTRTSGSRPVATLGQGGPQAGRLGVASLRVVEAHREDGAVARRRSGAGGAGLRRSRGQAIRPFEDEVGHGRRLGQRARPPWTPRRGRSAAPSGRAGRPRRP